MAYCCPRCGYTTERSFNFKKHLTSKIVCQPVLDDVEREDVFAMFFKMNDNTVKCDICEKCYKNTESLRKHKSRFHAQEQQTNTETNKLLKQIVDLLQTKVTNNTVVNMTQTCINNGVINMVQPQHEFLKEPFDYISDEYIMKCAKRLDNGLVDFIRTVRFNPEHPENMNVKMHVKRDKTLYVFKNGYWEICDAKWTLEEMIIHGARIIYQRFLSNSDQEKLFEEGSSESQIQSWLLSVLPRDNEKVLGRISKRLYAIILNNQNILVVEQPDNEVKLIE